ncbi:MAG: hypothetical protein RR135_06430 [Oscillospiraceae bacterium]
MCILKMIFLVATLIFGMPLISRAGEPYFVAPSGKPICFSIESLERQLCISPGQLSGVIMVVLPNADQGKLVCEGVEVEAYDYLPRDVLEWLVYVPYGPESNDSVGLIPDAEDADYAVVSLITSDLPRINSVSIPVGLYAWRQAHRAYWSDALATLAVMTQSGNPQTA